MKLRTKSGFKFNSDAKNMDLDKFGVKCKICGDELIPREKSMGKICYKCQMGE